MVVATTNKDPVTVDFVLVVEATANMVAHWATLRKAYVDPAIKYFNGRPPSALDYIGNHGSSQFAYVQFHSADQSPELLTKCSRAFQSPYNFSKALDDISFTGGGSERSSLASEGLAKALQLFDDLTQRRGAGNASKKICFLVCNSPPYDMPCQESYTYSGKTVEQLAELMGSKGIHLSVIAPQRIKALQQLYLCANQKKPPTMSYAQDPRHLVFISGFPLPTEHGPVKLNQATEQKQPEQQAITNNITQAISTASISSPAQHQSPASNQPFNHNTPSSVTQSPQQQQSTNITQSLSGQTDSIASLTSNNAVAVNVGSGTSAQPNAAGQAPAGQVPGFASNGMSAPTSMMQTSPQQPQLLQNTPSMNFPNLSNANSGANPNRIGSPFSRQNTGMSTGNITGVMSVPKPEGNMTANSNIKNLLQKTSQPQILLSDNTNPGLNGMAGPSNVTGGNDQSLFSDQQQSVMQGPGMQGQQQLQQQQQQTRMTPQSVGMPVSSIATPSHSLRNPGMQQLPPYSSSASIVSQGQNNPVGYNNQLGNQQISMSNMVSSTLTGSTGIPMHQNDISQMKTHMGMGQSFTPTSSTNNNATGGMMQNVNTQPTNNQMQQQQQGQMVQNMGHIEQQQGITKMMPNTTVRLGQGNFMGQNQQMAGQQRSSLQNAQAIANSVMEEAQRMAVNQNPRGANPNIRPGMSTQSFPNQQQVQGMQVQGEIDGGRMVWNGTLEWTEKRKMAPGANPARTTRTLSCQVFLPANQADDGWMNAGTWPPKLTMQLIPHMVFNSMSNQVRNNRSVTLRMSPSDLVNQLANIMKNKWMGLVQIPSPSPNSAENSYKVMLVIYSQKKGQFFGLLPLDPHAFISTIRQVIQRHQQPRPAQAAQQPPQMNPQMNVDGSGMMSFSQDRQQQNTNQPGQFQMNHNQIINRPNNIPQQPQQQNIIGQQGGIRVPNMNTGMSVQQPANQQMNMDLYRQQQQGQRMPGNQMQNATQMQDQSAMMGQQQQMQQSSMGQQQMQPGGNQQYMFQQMNGNMGQMDQNSDTLRQQQLQQRMRQVHHQQQQQQQQQQQHQQQNQQLPRNNMQMGQMTGAPRGMGDHEQLRSLLQTNGNGMGGMSAQRQRMPMVNQVMRQQGMRSQFPQNQQVRHMSMPANRMMGMQQQQQRYGL